MLHKGLVRKRKATPRVVNKSVRELSKRVEQAMARDLRAENEREKENQVFWVRHRSQWLHRDAHQKRGDSYLWKEVG